MLLILGVDDSCLSHIKIGSRPNLRIEFQFGPFDRHALYNSEQTRTNIVVTSWSQSIEQPGFRKREWSRIELSVNWGRHKRVRGRYWENCFLGRQWSRALLDQPPARKKSCQPQFPIWSLARFPGLLPRNWRGTRRNDSNYTFFLFFRRRVRGDFPRRFISIPTVHFRP